MVGRRIGFAGRRLSAPYVDLVGGGVGNWPLRCFPHPPAILNCALRLEGKYRLRNMAPRPPSPGVGEGKQAPTSVRSRGTIRWRNPISRPARQVRIQWCGSESDAPPAVHYGISIWRSLHRLVSGGDIVVCSPHARRLLASMYDNVARLQIRGKARGRAVAGEGRRFAALPTSAEFQRIGLGGRGSMPRNRYPPSTGNAQFGSAGRRGKRRKGQCPTPTPTRSA